MRRSSRCPEKRIESWGCGRNAVSSRDIRFLANGSAVEAIAVNPPASESVLRRAEPDRVDDAFPGFETEVPGDAWRDTIYRSRLGREAWRFAAIVAAIVLVIESLLAAAGARAGSRSAARPAGSMAPTP